MAVIKPPDHATRVAILRKRAALDHIAVTDGAVLELIAERITDNVRVLEGALIRIVAYHSLTQLPIDVELAETVLDEIHPRPNKMRRPRSRTSSTLSPSVLRLGGRTADLIEPRRERHLAAPGRDPSRLVP